MKKLMRYCGLGALLAGAAFCLLSCDDDATGPDPYTGPWTIVSCPEGPSYLNGVFFLGPRLGYAVGCEYILKYDGTAWKIDYEYPVQEGKITGGFCDVWFNSFDDGWAIGTRYDIEKRIQRGLIMHYDGESWKEVVHNTPSVWYEDVFFLDGNNGWVGGYGIARWDGLKWTYETDISFITDLYFNSPTDGWAVSKYSERIYHYDGSEWKKAHEGSYPSVELYGVAFPSPDRGWAGGTGCISGTQSNLLEYKNGSWRYYLEEPWTEGIRQTLNAVHFSGPDYGWAVGQMTFRWDGERWWYVKKPPPETHVGTLYDVYTINEDDAWAVGPGRKILHYEP